MEDTIKVALARWRDRQPNMASESFRNNLAQEIALLLREKGSYIEFTDSEIDEQKARETWVCGICGKSTYEIEYDYLGSGTNHLGCELKVGEENNDYVYSGDMKESRKKNWLQEKHEDKVFGHDQGGNYIPASEEVDGMYTDEEVKGWEEAVGYVEPDNDTDVELRDKIFEKQKHEFFENTQKQLYTEMTSEGLPEGGDSQAVKESHRLAEELVDSPVGYIYESPDGGKTIYQRKVGESKKTKLTNEEWKKTKNEKK